MLYTDLPKWLQPEDELHLRPYRNGLLWNGRDPCPPDYDGWWGGKENYRLYRIIRLVERKLRKEDMPDDVRKDLETRLKKSWWYLECLEGYMPGTPEACDECLLGGHPDKEPAEYRPYLRLVKR